jgi:hypothetical protein
MANGSLAVAACAPKGQLRLDPVSGEVQMTLEDGGFPYGDGSGSAAVFVADPGPSNALPRSTELRWEGGWLVSRRGWSTPVNSRGPEWIPTLLTEDTAYVVLNGGSCRGFD